MHWLFGYGSIIWRPTFPYREARRALAEGWRRRLWQGSTDHRGVPGAPGRVVTLLPEPAAACVGLAYAIEADRLDEVLSHLDHREKGGYRRVNVRLRLEDAQMTTAVTYIAERDNPNYLGPASYESIAAQVSKSHGPSGSNRDYVLSLAQALRELAVEQDDVFAVEALLRRAD